MNKAAVYHRATDSFCYPLDVETVHIRLQTASEDAAAISLRIGDPFDWEKSLDASGHEVWAWRSEELPMRRAGRDGIHDFWELRHRLPYRRCRYYFRIVAADGGVWSYGEQGIFPDFSDPSSWAERPDGGELWNTFVFPYINAVDVYRAPSWVSRTVWYQIFPDRFRNGDPGNDPPGTLPWAEGSVTNRQFYGGDLAGIVEKLDYLADLGVNGLYLTPIFASPSVHKYNTEDYLRVDPGFGSEAELSSLVEGCHRRGLRVMLDAVFNHAGRSFGPWLDVLEKGSASRYAEWFQVRSWPLFPGGKDTGDSRDAGFASFSFTTSMPKLNTANPELRDYLLGVAEHYVRDFGIDGWRLDVAGEIDHDFMRAFRARMKSLDPEIFIVGELWHDSMAWLRGDQCDAVMNYPCGNAIADFLLRKHEMQTSRDFENRLNAIDFSYPEPVMRHAFNLLDSHDTDRLIHRMGENLSLARLAWFLLFMLPGTPCIYYGSEYGLSGGGDPDNRRCMIWDEARQDRNQFLFMRSLIRLRRTYWKIFAEGKRRFDYLDEEGDFLALSLGSAEAGLLVLVNRSAERLESRRLERLLVDLGAGDWRELPLDPRETENGELGRALLPFGFRLLAGPPPA